MKSHTQYLTFHTKRHREYVHITPMVEAAVKASGVREGMALVSAMHITPVSRSVGLSVSRSLGQSVVGWFSGFAIDRTTDRPRDRATTTD